MKVYVLVYIYYDHTDIVGVMDNKDEAEAWIKKKNKNLPKHERKPEGFGPFYHQEYTINKVPT